MLTCPSPACAELSAADAVTCEACGRWLGLRLRPRPPERPRHCAPRVFAELERRAAAGETAYAVARELWSRTSYPTLDSCRKAFYRRLFRARRKAERAERGVAA